MRKVKIGDSMKISLGVFEPGFSIDFSQKNPPLRLCEDDRESLPKSAEQVELEIIRSIDPLESPVSGAVVRQKAMLLGANHCQALGEKILVVQAEIPESWNDFVIYLTATLWQSPFGGIYFPCLRKDKDGPWRLGMHWLDQPSWYRDSALIRIVE